MSVGGRWLELDFGFLGHWIKTVLVRLGGICLVRLLMGDTLHGVNDLKFVYLAGVGESKKTKTDVRPIWDRGK